MVSTRIRWWIRDGPATWKGEDIFPGRVSKTKAEAMLDHATASHDRDTKSFPHFCATFYSCEDPRDWGIVDVEE
jgi:hypothetical protein